MHRQIAVISVVIALAAGCSGDDPAAESTSALEDQVVELEGLLADAEDKIVDLEEQLAAADDQPVGSGPTEAAEGVDEADQSSDVTAEGSTRDNPLPAGTPVLVGEYRVDVTAVQLDRTEAIVESNGAAEEPPPEGSQYVIVQTDVTYLGAEMGTAASVDLGIIGNGNVAYTTFQEPTCGPFDDELQKFSELFTDGSVSGGTCFVVPTAEIQAGGLVLSVEAFIDDDRAFIALAP